MKAIIDGDIVCFRCAASAENDELWIATSRTKELVEQILHDTGADEYEVWLTGKGNFRYTVYPEYKANRIGMVRPKWEKEVKEYLIADFGANVSDGCEADDMMGAHQTENTIICTIDKDLKQIPGSHYNFVKREKFTVSREEADRFFYYQLLVGDPTDNIKGVPGIGKVKAERLLSNLVPTEYYNAVRDAYSSAEELDLNAQCIYIWRKENDNWKNILNDTAISQE